MKEFKAVKTYYVHEFTAVQNWFRNRGICIKEGDLNEWCYDGIFLYYTCNKKATEHIKPDELYGDVTLHYLVSEFFEPHTVISYKDSPFANKIKEYTRTKE